MMRTARDGKTYTTHGLFGAGIETPQSGKSTIDTVTGLRGIHFDHPPPAAATVEQRLWEAMGDTRLTYEVSRFDENDSEVKPD